MTVTLVLDRALGTWNGDAMLEVFTFSDDAEGVSTELFGATDRLLAPAKELFYFFGHG